MLHQFILVMTTSVRMVMNEAAGLLSMAYDLIVIEEQETPLAAKASHINYYLLTLMVIAALSIAVAVTSWVVKRENLKNRLVELNRKLNRDEKIPFKIKNIKESIEVAETDLSASML